MFKSSLQSKRAFGMALLASTVLGIPLTGCAKKESDDEDKIGKAKSAKATAPPAPLQVNVTPVITKSLSETVDVTGTLSSLNDVTVGSKLAGKVIAVYSREGDAVRVGQIVAQMDATDFQAQVDQANANYLAALSKLEQAKVQLRSGKTTLQITKEQTASSLKQAQAGLDSSKEQLAIVQKGARTQERQQAQENVDATKADRDRAKFDLSRAETEKKRTAGDLKRYQDLKREEAISAQQLDQAVASADSASAAYESAIQAFNAADSRSKYAQQSLSLVEEGSRKEDIRKAQAAVDQAKQMVVTAQSARSNVNLKAQDVETAQAGISAAQAGVRQMQATLSLAKQNVKDSQIVSPIDGVIAERKVEPGTQLGAGKDIVRLIALNTIFYDAQVSETQIAQIRAGQTATVHIDALSGKVFNGTVSKIYPVASATARSFTVRIALPNQAGALRPNLFARGQIVTQTHANALAIPAEAVLDSANKRGRVFVYVNGKAEQRKVTLGIATSGLIEVVSGLQSGDKIITTSLAQLQDGDGVQLANATASNP